METKFRKTIWDYYRTNKRKMPWRETTNPYHILISEVMLQQTQVSRVFIKYPGFIKQFPTLQSLASSPLPKLLRVWQGMGYNRRALYLKRMAEIITRDYKGIVPDDPLILDELPGIGYATACSIVVFAFNKPEVFIETNVRRVFIHFFFHNKVHVDDKEIIPLVKKTLDMKNPREWYYALMDYGSMLPKLVVNPNRKSKHYTKQSTFAGSTREVRGKIIKFLLKRAMNYATIKNNIKHTKLKYILHDLTKEGIIKEKKGTYSIT